MQLPAEAYVRQFEFARKVEAAQARLATANAEAGRLHAALKKPDPAFAQAFIALDGKVVALGGIAEAPNPNNAGWLPPNSTRQFSFLSQSLGALSTAADDADAAPSVDALAGYDALLPMLDASLADWRQIKDQDLAALNAKLRSAGQPELAIAASTGPTRP